MFFLCSDAEFAVKKAGLISLRGRLLRVEFPYKSQSGKHGSRNRNVGQQMMTPPPCHQTSSSHQIMVSGLAPTTSWQDLKDHFRSAGDVLFANTYPDGTGVVEFSSYMDMRCAIMKLDDTMIKTHNGLCGYVRIKDRARLLNLRNRYHQSSYKSCSQRNSPNSNGRNQFIPKSNRNENSSVCYGSQISSQFALVGVGENKGSGFSRIRRTMISPPKYEDMTRSNSRRQSQSPVRLGRKDRSRSPQSKLSHRKDEGKRHLHSRRRRSKSSSKGKGCTCRRNPPAPNDESKKLLRSPLPKQSTPKDGGKEPSRRSSNSHKHEEKLRSSRRSQSFPKSEGKHRSRSHRRRSSFLKTQGKDRSHCIRRNKFHPNQKDKTHSHSRHHRRRIERNHRHFSTKERVSQSDKGRLMSRSPSRGRTPSQPRQLSAPGTSVKMERVFDDEDNTVRKETHGDIPPANTASTDPSNDKLIAVD